MFVVGRSSVLSVAVVAVPQGRRGEKEEGLRGVKQLGFGWIERAKSNLEVGTRFEPH
jgi:hypothetical protein